MRRLLSTIILLISLASSATASTEELYFADGEVLLSTLKAPLAGVSAKRIGRESLHIRTKRGLLRAEPHIKRFSIKDNPCRAPKVKKVLSSLPKGTLCEPNWILTSSATPNDPRLSELWGLKSTSYDIAAPSAWNITTGSRNVVVGVIDSGIDYSHPDLIHNIWNNPGEIAGNGIDDDGNGYIDDIHGINAISGSGDPHDDNGHGTHCAGTIGAEGDNNEGVVGVNWKVSIIGCKFLSASGSGSLAHALKCLDYFRNLKETYGVDVVATNNSWSGGGYSQSLKNAIERHNTAGILFVAAAGNESTNNDTRTTYPANYALDNVISVAALRAGGNLAGFSNYGATTVHLAAPGRNILSTVPGGYEIYSGTSMAAPHVTGVAALLKSASPSLTAQDIKRVILTTTTKLSSLQSKTITGGLLNAHAALLTLQPTPTPTATVVATIANSDTEPTTTPTTTPTVTPPTTVPTVTPTEAPTSTPTSTPVPIAEETATPLPTSIPTTAPTPVPRVAPLPFMSGKVGVLTMSITSSRRGTVVTCSLRRKGTEKGISGYTVHVVNGRSLVASGKTDLHGATRSKIARRGLYHCELDSTQGTLRSRARRV